MYAYLQDVIDSFIPTISEEANNFMETEYFETFGHHPDDEDLIQLNFEYNKSRI